MRFVLVERIGRSGFEQKQSKSSFVSKPIGWRSDARLAQVKSGGCIAVMGVVWGTVKRARAATILPSA